MAASPILLALTVSVVLSPLAVATAGSVESWRARKCGVPLISRTDLWPPAVRRPQWWGRDVPLFVMSLAAGVFEWAVVAMFGVGGAMLVAAPWLVRHGSHVALGSWHVTAPGALAGACALGIACLAVVVLLLLACSHARDAFTRALRQEAVHERTSEELAHVINSRAHLADSFDDERRRIERDLHDGVQQELVALTITLGLLEHTTATLGTDGGHQIHAQVRDAHDQAEHCLARLRDTVHGIHPHELTDLGLSAALAALADRTPLPLVLTSHGDETLLDQATATALYHVASEALTNVLKHAQATRGEIDLGIADDVVVLRVQDNGTGHAPRVSAAPPTGGLAGLAERLDTVGGRLDLDSNPGTGTTLMACVPLTHNGGTHDHAYLPR